MNKQNKQEIPEITFYTKAGCHLCDEARELLNELASEVEYELTEVDIRNDMQLFKHYRHRIPVILHDETIIAEGRIEYSDLEHVFKAF